MIQSPTKPPGACEFCHRRKLRCDRVFPCSHCSARGLHATCVPHIRRSMRDKQPQSPQVQQQYNMPEPWATTTTTPFEQQSWHSSGDSVGRLPPIYVMHVPPTATSPPPNLYVPVPAPAQPSTLGTLPSSSRVVEHRSSSLPLHTFPSLQQHPSPPPPPVTFPSDTIGASVTSVTHASDNDYIFSTVLADTDNDVHGDVFSRLEHENDEPMMFYGLDPCGIDSAHDQWRSAAAADVDYDNHIWTAFLQQQQLTPAWSDENSNTFTHPPSGVVQ